MDAGGPPSANAQAPLQAGLDASIVATEAQVTEMQRAVLPDGGGVEATAERLQVLTVLRSVRESAPWTWLPPAIVEELGGVEYFVEYTATAAAALSLDAVAALPSFDWGALWSDLRARLEEQRSARIAASLEERWEPGWMVQRLSAPMRLA